MKLTCIWPLSSNCRLCVSTCAEFTVIAKFVSRSGGNGTVKTIFVNAVVESNSTGTELVWPICMTVLPMLAWMHSGTVTMNVIELLIGGLP